MESLRVKLVLVVNDEMIGTVSKWHHRGVRKTPSKASSHSYSKGHLIVLRSVFFDIYLVGVHTCDLVHSLKLGLVLILILHNFCL